MALEGEFPKDVMVPSLIQTLSMDKKTGVLYLKSNGNEAALGFEDGYVIASYFVRSGEFETLSSYLVKSGKISAQDFNRIEKLQKDTGIPIDELIIQEGFVTIQELEDIVKFKIQEVVDEILTWDRGTFSFKTEDKIYEFSRIKVFCNSIDILMEGIRRQDDWPRILEKIYDENIVFTKSDFPEIDVELSREELKVLEAIDGKKTVRDLVLSCACGKFRTYEALFHLLELKWIEEKEVSKKVTPEKITKEVEIPVKKKGIFPRVFPVICVIFVIVLNFLLVFFVNKKIPYVREVNFVPFIYEQEKNIAQALQKK